MAGQTTEAQAREVLDLTQGVELTKRPINDGYTSLAGNQHPDAGGDEARSHAYYRGEGTPRAHGGSEMPLRS